MPHNAVEPPDDTPTPTIPPASTGDVLLGTGYAPCHHGELLQGFFRDHDGTTCHGLVTLPMTGLGSYAEFRPCPATSVEDVGVTPRDRVKAQRAAALTLLACQRSGACVCGGNVHLHGTVPVGLGMGSSTSDILATVRAVSAAMGVELRPQTIARIAVRTEQASDPLMLGDRPILFAQREGRVLEEFGSDLPKLVVLGCTTGGGRPVNTLAIRNAGCDHEELASFELLRDALRTAIIEGDAALLGWVSTSSARRNQQRLPKKELAVLESIAQAAGAVGIQVAHSGNVAGVLFDPATPDLSSRLARCSNLLEENGLGATRRFGVGPLNTDPTYRGQGQACHSRASTHVPRWGTAATQH